MSTTPLVKELLEAGVHFGHQTKRWNPKMRRFIFGERSGIYIIDLEQTEGALTDAIAFVTSLAARGEHVLFVGTKRQAQETIRAEAGRAGQPYVVNRWLGGTLTNFQTIRTSVARLRQLQGWRDEGRFSRLSKKEVSQLTREMERLQYNLEGITEVQKLPGALFIIDPHREAIAVHEANRLNIPVVAICDTNCDPELVTFAVPGNDDAMRAIKLMSSKIADACLAGSRQAGTVQPMTAVPADVEAVPVGVEATVGPVTVDVLEQEIEIPPAVGSLEQTPAPVVPKAKRPLRAKPAKRPGEIA